MPKNQAHARAESCCGKKACKHLPAFFSAVFHRRLLFRHSALPCICLRFAILRSFLRDLGSNIGKRFMEARFQRRIKLRDDLDFPAAMLTVHLSFFHVCAASGAFHRRLLLLSIQFFISMAIVIGPTPPGTGVIAEATGNTLS